ncbi:MULTISPECIES: DUF6461 domain-containing protein [Nocardia]
MALNHGRSTAVAEDYEWIAGDKLFKAFCLTVVRGAAMHEILATNS